jgi:hypothetical protein
MDVLIILSLQSRGAVRTVNEVQRMKQAIAMNRTAGACVVSQMRWLCSVAPIASVVLATASAHAEPASAPVCARLAAADDASERAAAPTGPRKVWLSWIASDSSRELAPVVAGKVVRVLGVRDGQVLAVATAAQLGALPAGVMVIRGAEELDWVGCGTLGYRVPSLGRVAPQVVLPARWRDPGGARASYCLQLAGPPPDDADQAALAGALGLSDPSPLYCGGDAPATCSLSLTPRQAAAVVRLPFVRGLFRREPGFKIGASLACPGLGDQPIGPADLPAILRATTAPPAERITAAVTLDGDPEGLARFRTRLPAGVTIVEGADPMVTVSLERRSLPALAAMSAVSHIAALGPSPELATQQR